MKDFVRQDVGAGRRETSVVCRRTASLCYGQLTRNTVFIRYNLNPDGWLVQWRLAFS